jgi:hypothetical protein
LATSKYSFNVTFGNGWNFKIHKWPFSGL